MISEKREAEELIAMSKKVILHINENPYLYKTDAKEWWVNHQEIWEEKLSRLLESCPRCGGDCSSANAPVSLCPLGDW